MYLDVIHLCTYICYKCVKMNSLQERLKMIMKMNNLNASSFADRVGVQRSSVSHILTGRNKPSLDFIQKTLKEFPRVNGDWLITGRSKVEDKLDFSSDKVNTTVKEEPVQPYRKSEQHKKDGSKVKRIKRIVVFYDDNTFEELTTNAV